MPLPIIVELEDANAHADKMVHVLRMFVGPRRVAAT